MVMSFSQQNEPNGFDDFGDVNTFGATGVAGQAGGTDPNGF